MHVEFPFHQSNDPVLRDSGTGVESPQLSVPLPGLVPGGEWRDLARMIGNALKLRISPAGELTAGIPVRSYTFSAAAEDGACSIRVRTPFHGERLKTLGCTGSVWVDSAGRIVRIFEKLDTGAQTPLSHLSISLLYGELPGSGETVPAEMAMVAETKTGETYSSRVHYQGYRRAQGEAAESAGLLAARHP